LLLRSLGESNGEQSQDETIGSLGLHAGLDEGVPLLDHGTSLISRDVHAIEVGVAIKTFNLINLEFKLSPGLGLGLVVAVGQRNGEDTTFQAIRGLLLTSSLVAWSQSDASLVKSWGQDVVPFLLDEWVSTIQIQGQYPPNNASCTPSAHPPTRATSEEPREEQATELKFRPLAANSSSEAAKREGLVYLQLLLSSLLFEVSWVFTSCHVNYKIMKTKKHSNL
jgi:hypothetical protein